MSRGKPVAAAVQAANILARLSRVHCRAACALRNYVRIAPRNLCWNLYHSTYFSNTHGAITTVKEGRRKRDAYARDRTSEIVELFNTEETSIIAVTRYVRLA